MAPVLCIAAALEAGPVLDVGSGNGSPGLVLALLRPELEITLLEPRAKRWAFLREAARAAGRAEVRVFRGRHDAWPGPPAARSCSAPWPCPWASFVPWRPGRGRVVVVGRRPPGAPGFQAEPDLGPDVHVFRRST